MVALVCALLWIMFECMLVTAWHLNALLVDVRPDMFLFVVVTFFFVFAKVFECRVISSDIIRTQRMHS